MVIDVRSQKKIGERKDGMGQNYGNLSAGTHVIQRSADFPQTTGVCDHGEHWQLAESLCSGPVSRRILETIFAAHDPPCRSMVHCVPPPDAPSEAPVVNTSTFYWSPLALADLGLIFCRAILDLKLQRDKLKQYRNRITVLTDRETAIAKECLAQDDRRRALLALRRKKYQESLLDKTDGQLAQLEQLASQVEFALVQKDVMYGLQQGTEVLQAINKEMGGIEAVERLMGETEDARAYQEVRIPSTEGSRREICC